MNTVNEILASSSNFNNVKPMDAAFLNDHKDSLRIAYTGSFNNCLYAVWTQDAPYQQYIIIVDMASMKVIS